MKEENIRNALECFGNSIYRLSYYMLSDDQDAQDVVQETMMKYMEKAPTFDNAAQEKAWLLKVANNICIDMLRFRKRVRFMNQGDENILAQMAAKSEMDDSSEEFIKLIFSLKEKLRNAVYLYYYEEYSTEEIASILKISNAAVRKRLERGRVLLKDKLQEEQNERGY